MALDEKRIASIVSEVLERLDSGRRRGSGAARDGARRWACIADLDRAVEGARAAFQAYDADPARDPPPHHRRRPRGALHPVRDPRRAGGRGERPGAGRGQDPEEPPGHRAHAGHRGPRARHLDRRPRPDADGAGALRRDRRHHAGHEPQRDDHQQRHLDDRGRQHRGLLPAPVRRARSRSSRVDLINRAALRGGRAAAAAAHGRAAQHRGREGAAATTAGIRLNVVTGGPGVVKEALRRRQEGHHRRAGQPARRWWTRPPTSRRRRATSWPGRPSTTTSSAPTRRRSSRSR